MKSYKTLEQIFKKINDLEQTKSVLHWDMAVVMPSGGSAARGEQISTIESIRHAIITDEGIKDLLDDAMSNTRQFNHWQKANLRKMESVWKHNNAVPQKLVTELSKLGTQCEMVWREARPANDFKKFAPALKKVIEVVKEIAKAKGSAFNCSPYDALIDQYDMGRKTKQIDIIFDDLKGFLPDFTSAVIEKQKKDKKFQKIKGSFPVEAQKALGKKIMDAVGFNFEQGRVDESRHPFCGGYKSDVRITARYNEEDFLSGMMAILHETGHAMYEAGLPDNWQGLPVGDSAGMTVHESQSLLLEMQAGRTLEFFEYATPLIAETLKIKNKNLTAGNLYLTSTRVTPSLIRVDADEVTYPAHILLRYYLEKYLLSGDMDVYDLPEAWSQGMEKFLGIVPDSDANGCMQDIHWVDGSLGYFPTYTLGAISAAQIFAEAKNQIPDLMKNISNGEFAPLIAWLGVNVHEKGSSLSSDEILKSATGKTLDVETYKNYLSSKYLGE